MLFRSIEEAVTHYRTLAKALPERYLPELAQSLNNLSVHLSAAGRNLEALTAIEEAVAQFADSGFVGYLVFQRSRARLRDDLSTAVLADAMAGFEGLWAAGVWPLAREVRQWMRGLRSEDGPGFDAAWPDGVEVPPWLIVLEPAEEVARAVVEWIGTEGWDASEGYLRGSEALVCSDAGESVVALFADANPGNGQIGTHTSLLEQARKDGIPAAYARLRSELLVAALQALDDAPDAEQLRALLSGPGASLITPEGIALITRECEMKDWDPMLRSKLAIADLASQLGVDEAIDAISSPEALAALRDRLGGAVELNLERLAAGDPGDREASMVHAALALGEGLQSEAQAGLRWLDASIEPWERQETARRFTEIATERGVRADAIEAALSAARAGRPAPDGDA